MGPEWALEILTRLAVAGLLLRGTRWQSSTAHLVELSPRLHVLRPEGGLNSLEQSFQPSDQLGLGDSDFRLAWGSLERDRERAQLVLQILGQAFLQLAHRPIVDLAQAFPTRFVHRGLADILDRKSTRLNSSHGYISYAVFCLKKKKKTHTIYVTLST